MYNLFLEHFKDCKISETTWRQQLHEPILKPCLLVLKGYPNNKLDILGMCEVHVTAEGVTKTTTTSYLQGSGFLGRNWLLKLKLNWQEIAKTIGITKNLTISLDELLTLQFLWAGVSSAS